MMASAQVVETPVNTNNSPSQDYTTNPDDHSNHNTFAWIVRKDVTKYDPRDKAILVGFLS